LRAGVTNLAGEVNLQILRYAIVIEERIVNIEEEHNFRVGIGAMHTISRIT
jgi:hypothetical protein